jgi:hypothetical protein
MHFFFIFHKTVSLHSCTKAELKTASHSLRRWNRKLTLWSRRLCVKVIFPVKLRKKNIFFYFINDPYSPLLFFKLKCPFKNVSQAPRENVLIRCYRMLELCSQWERAFTILSTFRVLGKRAKWTCAFLKSSHSETERYIFLVELSQNSHTFRRHRIC